jgi:hypothetical protein
MKITLTPEEWQTIYEMVDLHMKRNILGFDNTQLDAGWGFLAAVRCGGDPQCQ